MQDEGDAHWQEDVGSDDDDDDEDGGDEDGDADEAAAVDEALEILQGLDNACSDEPDAGPAQEASQVHAEAAASEGHEQADGAGGAPDILGNLRLGFAREPGLAEIRFSLGHGEGELRYNLTGEYIRAYCPCHEGCVRQRATRPHPSPNTAISAGQGRPVGALVAWIQEARNHATKEAHVAAKTADFDTREAARLSFYTLQGGIEFAEEYEREQRDGEGDEPRAIR